MYEKLIPVMLMLLAGVAWRKMEPGGVSVTQIRAVLNSLVINLLAPALILNVFLQSAPDITLLKVPATGVVVILAGMAVCVVLFGGMEKLGWITRPQAGALILATAFGNGMGAAVPVIEGLYGAADAIRVPLVYDLMATIPIVWSVGVMLVARYGADGPPTGVGLVFLKLPPFWALIIAIVLNLSGITLPGGVSATIASLGMAAVPLLLFLVGTTFELTKLKLILLAIPALAIKIIGGGTVGYLAANALGLSGELLGATVITAAAPSIAVGIALSDRFKLDSALFSTVLTLTTVGYVLVAPYLQQMF
ncbi:MAG: auxin efflux carrier family protein [Gammaproteobacteria bacterium]|nr:MAG: auxin efflux carrier family protein [Gammaproteobacteria bacterium]